MSDSNHFFVGEDLEFLTGKKARKALAELNDSKYVQPSQGVIHVPLERWMMAQNYERRTWMEAGAHASDDRNWNHAKYFNDYASIRGCDFSRSVELGCGPFTNLRVIAHQCSIKRCMLVDPLIVEYRKHRHCSYRLGFIEISKTKFNTALGQSVIGRAIRKMLRSVYPNILYNGLPIEKMVASSIEEMPEVGQFDLIVMINVLEHCFDAKKIFDRILNISKPGSLFVFHDKLYRAEDVEFTANTHFDAGHPLRVDQLLVKRFLEDNFKTRFVKHIEINDEYNGIDLSENVIYFIGERLS